MQEWLPKESNFWAVDLETLGLDPMLPDSKIIGIGFANQDKVFYLDLTQLTQECHSYLKEYLITREKLTAFNAKFDASFLWVYTGQWLNWYTDTYGLFKYMSTDGFPGQKWNLETAQLEYLGWLETNKDVLNDALKERGLSKAEMGLLPPEILGPYCATDADAHWQLHEELMADIEEQEFAYLLPFHQREYLTLVKLLIEQQLRGIAVNRDGLKYHYECLESDKQMYMEKFFTHPIIKPFIDEYNQSVIEQWKKSEPPKFTKKGDVTVRWQKWAAKEYEVRNTNHFNPNSKQKLGPILYNSIATIKRETAKDVTVEVDGKEYTIDKTEKSKQYAVTKKILPIFGEPGQLLRKYNSCVKEQGYVKAPILLSEYDGNVRPDYNSCGTITCRLSGGGFDDE